MARRFVNQGKSVRVFKIGPDYLDPTILELASRQRVYNLDLWDDGGIALPRPAGQSGSHKRHYPGGEPDGVV